jgi:hypothetical protein
MQRLISEAFSDRPLVYYGFVTQTMCGVSSHYRRDARVLGRGLFGSR